MRTSTKLALLSSLYLSQGLPYGFFTTALPVVMRNEKVSLVIIGASSILAAPWALKFLWASVVDRFSNSPLGARRGWILPLQLVTMLMALSLGFAHDVAEGTSALWTMAIGLFVMNTLAATQDIATDGLAVDLLSDEERGHGNGVQVAAYRVGMIIGGGGLVKVFAHSGWHETFVAMALILAVVTIPIAVFREPKNVRRIEEPPQLDSAIAFLKRPGMLLWIALVMIYKLGDALPGPMARTMLVDGGYTLDQIGDLFGIYGSLFGFLGAMTGGFLAKRRRLLALMVGGVLHTLLLSAYAIPAFANTDASLVAVLVVVEHFTGGIATVSLFTAMMDVCDPKQGGTEYTVQASAVVFVQFLGSVLSGISAQHLGYGAHFLLVGAVSAIGVIAMAAGFSKQPRFVFVEDAAAASADGGDGGRSEAKSGAR